MLSGRCKMTKFHKKLWSGLVIMALLSPLGVFLPSWFRAEDAWGEWSSEQLKEMLGFTPVGLEELADLWKAPIADYNPGGDGASIWIQAVWYVFSAIIGTIIVSCVVYALSRFVGRK
jgi:cobalt/nickel transport protein